MISSTYLCCQFCDIYVPVLGSDYHKNKAAISSFEFDILKAD